MEGRERLSDLDKMEGLFDSLRQTYAGHEGKATHVESTGRLSSLSDMSLGLIDLDKVPEGSMSKFLAGSFSVSVNEGLPQEYLNPGVKQEELFSEGSPLSTSSTDSRPSVGESSMELSNVHSSREVLMFTARKPSSVHSDTYVLPTQQVLDNLHSASLPNFQEQIDLKESRPRGSSFNQPVMVERPSGDGEHEHNDHLNVPAVDSSTPSLCSSDSEGGGTEGEATPTECSSLEETLSDIGDSDHVGERLGTEGQEDSREPPKLLLPSIEENHPLLPPTVQDPIVVGDGEGNNSADDVIGSARDSPTGNGQQVATDSHFRGNGAGDGVDLSSDGEVLSEDRDTRSVSSESLSEPYPRLTHPEDTPSGDHPQTMLERESVLRPPIVAGQDVSETRTVGSALQVGGAPDINTSQTPLEGETVPVTLPSASSARSCFLSGGSLIHSDHKRPVVLGEKEGEQTSTHVPLVKSASEGYFSTPVTPKESQELLAKLNSKPQTREDHQQPLLEKKNGGDEEKNDFQVTSLSLPEAENVIEQLASLYPPGAKGLEGRESTCSTVSDLSSEESLDFGVSQAFNPFDGELPGEMSVEFPSGMSGTGFDSMTIMSTSTLQHQLDQEESVLNKFKGENDTFNRWSNGSLQTSQQPVNITGCSGSLNQSVGTYFAKKSADMAGLGLPPSPEGCVLLTEEDLTPDLSGDEQDDTLVGTTLHDTTADNTILAESRGLTTRDDGGPLPVGTHSNSSLKTTLPSSVGNGFTDLTFVIPKLQIDEPEVPSGPAVEIDSTQPPSSRPNDTTQFPLSRPNDTTQLPSSRPNEATQLPSSRPTDPIQPGAGIPPLSSAGDIVTTELADSSEHTVLVSDVSITTITGDLNLSGISIDGIETPLSERFTPVVALTRPESTRFALAVPKDEEEERRDNVEITADRGSISEFLQSSSSSLTSNSTKSTSSLCGTTSSQGSVPYERLEESSLPVSTTSTSQSGSVDSEDQLLGVDRGPGGDGRGSDGDGRGPGGEIHSVDTSTSPVSRNMLTVGSPVPVPPHTSVVGVAAGGPQDQLVLEKDTFDVSAFFASLDDPTPLQPPGSSVSSGHQLTSVDAVPSTTTAGTLAPRTTTAGTPVPTTTTGTAVPPTTSGTPVPPTTTATSLVPTTTAGEIPVWPTATTISDLQSQFPSVKKVLDFNAVTRVTTPTTTSSIVSSSLLRRTAPTSSHATPTDATSLYTLKTSTASYDVQRTTPITSTVKRTTPITSTVQRTMPITSTVQRTTPVTSTVQRTTSVTSTVQRTTSVTSTVQRTTPITSTVQRTTPITSTVQRTAPITSTVQRTTPITSTVQRTSPITSTVQRTTPLSPEVITPPKNVLDDDTSPDGIPPPGGRISTSSLGAVPSTALYTSPVMQSKILSSVGISPTFQLSPSSTPPKANLSPSQRYSTPRRSSAHSYVGSPSTGVRTSPKKLTARQLVRAPENVVFGRVCCIGSCLEESFTLKSHSDRWSESRFSLLELYKNGEKLSSPQEHTVFNLPPVCHLGPKFSDDVKIGFSPKDPGTYEAIVSISTGPLMLVSSEQDVSSKATVILKARAEEPRVKVMVGRNMSGAADFGLVQSGSSHSMKVCLVNEGLSDVQLQLVLDTSYPLWHCFTLADIPKEILKKTHLIPSPTSASITLPANSALVSSLSPLRGRSPSQHASSSLAQITSQSHSFSLRFQAPKKHTSDLLPNGPVTNVNARLVLKYDGGIYRGKVLGEVEIKVCVGVAKLYTPHSFQVITLSACMGRSTSVDVPLKNAGNMPVDVAFKISPRCDSLTVTPSKRHFEEGEKSSVMLIYTAPQYEESMEHDLIMHLEPSGPVYKLKIASSSISARETRKTTPKRIPSLLPSSEQHASPVSTRGDLLCSKQFIHWGCVKEGVSACETITLRNSLPVPVSLSLSIADSHAPFFLRNLSGPLSSSLSCDVGSEDVKIDVVFSPSTKLCYHSKLYIRDVTHGKQYKIPLCGYGGCAQIETANCRDTPNGAVMDCGEVCRGARKAVKVKVVNNGRRAAFLRVLCSSVKDGHPTTSTTTTVIPTECVVQAHTATDLLVICHITASENLQPLGEETVGVAELSLTWGDELMRSRFRQSQRKDPHTNLPDNMVPYLKDFVDQREQDQEDFGIELSTVEEESLLFEAHLKCTHVTLVGHTKEGLPLSSPTEGVASTMSSPRRIWTVEPKHLLLWTTPTSAGDVPLTYIKMLNYSSEPLLFSFSCDKARLRLAPDRGTLPPHGCVDILVTHNDQGSHSIPPPWSGDILAHCGGRVEKVHVELISGKYPPKAPPTASPTSNVKCSSSHSLDHSIVAPDTHRVNVEVQTTPGVRGVEGLRRSGYPNKRMLGDPSVGRLGDPSVKVSNDEFPSLLDLNTMAKILPTETIIFPLTLVNSSSEQSFQIHNPHSGTMSWLVTHVSPPRIRDTTAPDGAVSKETSAVFWIHQNNGSVPPLSSVEVPVAFHPRLWGTYSQMWELCVRFKDEHAKRMTLSFVGQATPPAGIKNNSYPMEPSSTVTTHITALHHQQNGGSPTVSSSSGRKPSHDSPSKRKSLVYFDKEVLKFSSTASGDKSVRKIKVCNGDNQTHKFTVIRPYQPFSIDHPKFELKSRQYARLPVHFAPREAGHKYTAILAVKTESGHQLFTVLKGKSV